MYSTYFQANRCLYLFYIKLQKNPLYGIPYSYAKFNSITCIYILSGYVKCSVYIVYKYNALRICVCMVYVDAACRLTEDSLIRLFAFRFR